MKEYFKEIVRKKRWLVRCWAEVVWIKMSLGLNSKLKNELEEYIKEFVPIEKQDNKKYICKIKKDILYSRLVYLVAPDEYFFYRFEKLNDIGRRQYVGKLQQRKFWNKFNQDDTHFIFLDKGKTYKYFEKYYKRDVLKIDEKTEYSTYALFIEKHPQFIFKPLMDHQGNGVKIVDLNRGISADNIFQECVNMGGGIVEEIIVQSEEMAKFNASSVNTIRFVTFYYKERLHKICAAIRMGRNGSCIDNACAGGIYATIDMDTGIIDSPGTSHKMEKYIVHPDNGIQILGAKIPRWDELNRLVEEVVTVVPNQMQVGWDFALSDKGWVIVEGNDRPGIQWIVHDRGLRKEMQCMYDAYSEQ